MKLYGITLSLLVLFGISTAAEKDAPKFDAAKLEGKWKITSGIKYGEKLGDKAIGGVITIEKGKITIKDETMTHVMTFKVDGSKSPVEIDMTGVEGPAKDLKSEGLIELKGDELKLVYSFPGEKRPTAFESKKESKVLFFTLKKEAK